MTSAYPDIEGQLYTTTTPNATYTEAEARQRAATAREVAGAASAAGASALASAKAYTDQKVTGFATTAAMNAADALTLSNAKAYTDEQLAGLDLGSGSGVGSRLVSGGVEFSAEDESLPPFVVATTEGAVVEGVTLTAGQMAAFWFLSGEWHVMVYGQDTVWRSTVKPDTRIAVTPAAPTFTDDPTNGGGTWETATQSGVRFSPASGTATPGQVVTVTATVSDTEQYKFAAGATTSWTFRFSPRPDTTIVVTPTAPSFQSDAFLGGGRWTTPTITGVKYEPASGTATPGQEVTIRATPASPDYRLTGETSFQYKFPDGPSALLGTASVAYTPSTLPTGGAVSEWKPSLGSGPTLKLGHVSGGTPTAVMDGDGVEISADSYLEGPYSVSQPNTVLLLAKSETNTKIRFMGSTPTNSVYFTGSTLEILAGARAAFEPMAWEPGVYSTVGGVFNGANSYGVTNGEVLGPKNAGAKAREFIRLNADTNKSTDFTQNITYLAVLIWDRALSAAELAEAAQALGGLA